MDESIETYCNKPNELPSQSNFKDNINERLKDQFLMGLYMIVPSKIGLQYNPPKWDPDKWEIR